MSAHSAARTEVPPIAFRPAQVCRALLAALQASQGRRRARKRDQTPDAIGLNAKRTLLERVLRDDPEPDRFEAWLLEYVHDQVPGDATGSARAMAQSVLEEWHLAHAMPQFATWLEHGAPSADASETPSGYGEPRRVGGELHEGNHVPGITPRALAPR